MAFSRDGRWLITATHSPGLDIWPVPGDLSPKR
jgi:hypothetical protein